LINKLVILFSLRSTYFFNFCLLGALLHYKDREREIKMD